MKENVILNRMLEPKKESEPVGPWRALARALSGLNGRIDEVAARSRVEIGDEQPFNLKAEGKNLRVREITINGVTFVALTRAQ